MSKCCGYEVHPAAELFPMMPKSELKELADDIKKNGLIHKIILTDGKVLDGRNRLLACEMADVIPYFAYYRGGQSPTEYVIAMNLKRRQLTASQRACIAVNALPLLEAEIEEERRKRISEARSGETSQKVDSSQKNARRSNTKAASLAQTNRQYVADANKIRRKSIAVFEEVKNGTKTIGTAKKELGWSRKPHPEPDNLSTLRAVWGKCNDQEKTAFVKSELFLKWMRQNR